MGRHRRGHPLPPLLPILACLLGVWLGIDPAWPQMAASPASPEVAAALESPQQIEQRIAALENATGMDEQQRNRLLELYRSALERLNNAAELRRLAAEYQEAVAGAPARLRELQAAAGAVTAPPPVAAAGYADADLAELRRLLSQEKATLAALQSQLADTEGRLQALRGRPTRAREELAEARLRQEAAERELQTPAPAGEEALAEARRTALLAQQLAAGAEIRALEQELLSLDVRLQLLGADRELLARRAEAQAAQVQQLEALANRRSLEEAEDVTQAAEQAAATPLGEDPLVRETAAANATLSEELARLVALIERSNRQRQQLQTRLESLRDRIRTTQEQLEIVGLNEALGEVLRQERRRLPAVAQFARSVDERQQLIAEARLRQFRLEQAPPAAGEATERARSLLREARPAMAPAAAAALVDQLAELLRAREALQEKLAINYGRYVDELLDLNRDEQLLVGQAQQYGELLDKSLFWIASAELVGRGWLRDLRHSLAWLVDPARWRQVAGDLREAALAAPLEAVLSLLLFLLLGRARPVLKTRLRTVAAVTGTAEDHFGLSLYALVVTLLLALPWPLLLGLAGWLLGARAEAGPFSLAVALALRSMAAVALAIEFFRQLCRDGGVAQAHFRWRARARANLRRQLSWLMAVALPMAFLITLTEVQPEELHRDSLGRLAFVIASLALALFAWRALGSRIGRLPGLNRERRRGWWRLRRLLRVAAVVLPVGLAGLALYGYYYTALQLESRLFSSGWLLVGLAVAANLGLRWIRLSHQQLARRPARRERMDLGRADEQARTLLRTAVLVASVAGLWLIWSELLPALGVLEDVVLWRYAGGGEEVLAVTLGDLLLAVVVVVLTLVAAGNLPGAVEIGLLARLEVDPGNRYAITAISRYVIVAIGLVWGLNLVGVSWEQSQWLIAALGVGLGFGLQEIFANFVSGLILLFERPVRVGDTVTVGDLSGQVSQIRIRATTITDWDRREIIIPNKTFITGQLINWTLSDQITRVVLKLDLAYGSDPDRVHGVLLSAAAANPVVLRDPEPAAFFLGLGESALRFELHVYVARLGDRLKVTHELLGDLQRRLREAGFEIPYPQRDLHIRSLPDPLAERLAQAVLGKHRPDPH